MDRKALIKYCTQNILYLSTEQLLEVKSQIDNKLKSYEDID